MTNVLRSSFRAVLVLLAAALLANAQKQPTMKIIRDGKQIEVYVPFCFDYCGVYRNFDLSYGSQLVIDSRGFVGTMLGRDGDYFLHETLKKAALSEGQKIIEEVGSHTGVYLNSTPRIELIAKRVTEVFGDRQLTPERLASIALVIGATPSEVSSGVFAFRREYAWNFSRQFSDGQKELARRVWRANFFAGAPANQQAASRAPIPAVTVLKNNTSSHRALNQALKDGCVDPDEAINRYLAYALMGTGLQAGTAKLELSEYSPSALWVHLAPDASNALSIADVLQKKTQYALALTERDSDNRITGNIVYFLDDALTNYVKSYFHGESCRDR